MDALGRKMRKAIIKAIDSIALPLSFGIAKESRHTVNNEGVIELTVARMDKASVPNSLRANPNS